MTNLLLTCNKKTDYFSFTVFKFLVPLNTKALQAEKIQDVSVVILVAVINNNKYNTSLNLPTYHFYFMMT